MPIGDMWPKNLAYVHPDAIASYPCQSCHRPFNSRNTLANHPCTPRNAPEKATQRTRGANLTAEQVLGIRAACAEGHTQRAVAERFGVHATAVSNIILRKTYTDI